MGAALSMAPGVKGFTLAASTFRSGESLRLEESSSPSLVKRSRGLTLLRGRPPEEQKELGESRRLREPIEGSLVCREGEQGLGLAGEEQGRWGEERKEEWGRGGEEAMSGWSCSCTAL